MDSNCYDSDQNLNHPILQQHTSVNIYSDTNLENEKDKQALEEHINYIKTKFPQYSIFDINKTDPKTFDEHPNNYHFYVQSKLPFRIDQLRIENLYDTTRQDVYRTCFLEPIAEDNQFQGWNEEKLTYNPLIMCIQELTSQINPDIMRNIYFSWFALVILQIFNIIALCSFAGAPKNQHHSFGKVLGSLLSITAIITTFMIAFQVARILRGFSTLKKLIFQFGILLFIQLIDLPIIGVVNSSWIWVEIVVILYALIFIKLFYSTNKQTIILNSQLYVLINGCQKKLF